MPLLCRDCKEKLKLFDEFEEGGYITKIYRCETCELELNVFFAGDGSLVSELCFWADYYGENKQKIVL